MDFEGSGLSSGEFVSLGLFEKTQVSVVVDFLTERYHIGTVGIWGRSMGAVTAILYAEEYPERVGVLVVDSPFSSLKKMVQDIAFEHYKIPAFVVNLGLSVISSSIQERIGVDLFEKLDPYVNCAKCQTPVTFIAASCDGLVQPKRVNQMFKNYGSQHQTVKKRYLETSGSHTDSREDSLIHTCFMFIATEFDAYIESKAYLDTNVFDMKKYTRVKGVKNAKSSKKVLPVDRKGNIKIASKLNNTRLPNSGINLLTSRSGVNFNTSTLKETINMQEYKDKISSINLLKPNIPKSNHNKFKELNKENLRKVSPRVPLKVLESEIELRNSQYRQENTGHNQLNLYSSSTTRPTPSTSKLNSILGIKHSRTRSMTGLLPFPEKPTRNVESPSFLGHAAQLGGYNSQPRTMGSRHNSYSNLLQDDLNLSIQQPFGDQVTPAKAKVQDKDSSTSSINLYSSNSRSLKRLEEVCNFKSGGFRGSSYLVNMNCPSIHDMGTAANTPNDSHIYNRSEWYQFGFSNKPSFSNESFIDDNRRLETLARERYGPN
jgi:hypothetical protein